MRLPRSLTLPLGFLALTGAAHLMLSMQSIKKAEVIQAQLQRRAVPGTFPDAWVDGSDCATQPLIQVHKYNENLYILRETKCAIFEAPFMYLIFGDDRVLLLDTGANASTPVVETVEALVQEWLDARGQASIDITIGHTHGHFDHVQNDPQFLAWTPPWGGVKDGTSPTLAGSIAYFGFQDWPNDIVQIDLGNRVLDVIPTPGHHAAEVSFYDRRTQLLLSGDIVYPGHLFVFSPVEWFDFVDSIARLVAFAAENPIEWVVGCHIEYSTTPGQPYAYGTAVHPNEAVLEFKPPIFDEVLEAALEQNGDPECTIYDRFVIHPVYKCGINWNG